VTYHAHGVTVHTTSHDTFHADFVVLCVPTPALSALKFSPPLPPWKAAALKAVTTETRRSLLLRFDVMPPLSLSLRLSSTLTLPID
jgi:monoamine oxidase